MQDALLGYLAGGKDPSHVAKLDMEFSRRLAALLGAAPGGVSIYSGYRSPERQAELWEAALVKYGDPEIADDWVARPGTSNHNFGLAADLQYASPEVKAWVHQNAANFGMHFPMDHEPWHIEMIDGQPVAVSDAAPGMMAPPAAPSLADAFVAAAPQAPAQRAPVTSAPMLPVGNAKPQTNPTITSLLEELQNASMAPAMNLKRMG